MSVACDQLADAIAGTAELLLRYLNGFDDSNATAQAAHLPNHVAWTLGHLALTMHRAAEKISGQTAALAWDPEPFAFGSTPVASRDAYPPLRDLVQRYRDSLALLVSAVRAASDADLVRDMPWGRSTVTARDLAIRMVFHNGTHCGQIVDLRRALGMPRAIR